MIWRTVHVGCNHGYSMLGISGIYSGMVEQWDKHNLEPCNYRTSGALPSWASTPPLLTPPTFTGCLARRVRIFNLVTDTWIDLVLLLHFLLLSSSCSKYRIPNLLAATKIRAHGHEMYILPGMLRLQASLRYYCCSPAQPPGEC